MSSRVSFQIFAIIVFALIVFIGWDFSQRVTVMARRQQMEQALDREIIQAQATHTALEEKKKFVQTDQYVEDKVRKDEHYVRDGESIVQFQVTPAATPMPSAPSSTPAPQTNPWQDLLDFLFGP